MQRFLTAAAVAALIAGAPAAPASAQSRPLVTEDPETVPAGNMLVEVGLDLQQDAFFPASGLRGRLWKFGTLGLSIGISSIAEVQVDGGVRNGLRVESIEPAPLTSMLDFNGDTTSDIEDLRFGTKIRFLNETASTPAMAVRFWTRLPNASNESGLGLDTTDFHLGLAVAKTVQAVRVAGNFGWGILGDPVRADEQNDVLEYGLSVARAIAAGAEIVAEINGRLNTRATEDLAPVGTETGAVVRIGGRYTRGPVRVDGALLVGVTERDPTWGFTFGATWVFKAFEIQ
jgi:hypothetical protein